MGSGKTAVGRQLARHLDMEFVDSDNEIERRTGVDIAFIFDKEGEQGFRVRECAVIADLASRENVVLATGGGAVVDPVTGVCSGAAAPSSTSGPAWRISWNERGTARTGRCCSTRTARRYCSA